MFVWCVPQVSHSADTDKGQVCNGTSNTSDITTPNIGTEIGKKNY